MSWLRGMAPLPEDAAERLEVWRKGIALIGIPIVVFTIFFKFAPDLAWAGYQRPPSYLTSFESFRSALVGIHASRFAGNEIEFGLAKALAGIFGIPSDIRMHPLRIAAALTCSVYIGLALLPMLSSRRRRAWRWSVYYSALLSIAALSLAIYKPYDLPALMFIALGLLAVLEDRWWLALGSVAACGPFRETGLHIVWIAVCCAILRGGRRRFAMAAAMAAVWAVELKLIRWVFGIPGGFGFPGDLLSPSMWLSVVTVAAFAAVAALDLLARRDAIRTSGEAKVYLFFVIQILAIPAWIVFYRSSSAGLAEFRVLLPVVLPLAFSLAWTGADPTLVRERPPAGSA